MKYLVGREIRSGSRIPLLCELRDVAETHLEDFLVDRFGLLLGVPTDPEVFRAFADNGNVSFLLDGFDEVDVDSVQRVLGEIEDLSFKYPKCRMVITSRPESACKNLTDFTISSIKPLEFGDLHSFYKKITGDVAFSNRLVMAIQSSVSQIQGLVSTPLLATLLAVSYRAAHKIPVEFSEFYEEIFQVLLIRHDASKQGWRRKRSSGLTDRQIQQLFEAFSFGVRRKKVVSVDMDEALELVDDGATQIGMKVDAQAYLEDVRKITCLILEEARRIEYVHASVAHYFAARFVKSRPDAVAKNIYKQLLEPSRWQAWSEELRFLQQIDSHRYNKFFALADLSKSIEDANAGLASLLGSLHVERRRHAGSQQDGYVVVPSGSAQFKSHSANALNRAIFLKLFSRDYPGARSWAQAFLADGAVQLRSFADIANDRGPMVMAELQLEFELYRAQLEEQFSQVGESVALGERQTDFLTLN